MRGRAENKIILSQSFILYLLFFAGLLSGGCSFDYGENPSLEKDKPDIVMENIEYVRVRGGDPLVRFKAEHAERWEDRNVMDLKNFTFEQFEDQGESVNAEGRAGSANIQLGPGNISLGGGVRISVDSEDVVIRTMQLEWKDKEKILSGGEKDEVEIERSDGTSFSGRGFTADARNRTWTFLGEVRGTYVEKEEGEEDSEAAGGYEDWTYEERKELPMPAPAAPQPPLPRPPVPETGTPAEEEEPLPETEQVLPVIPEDK